VAKPIIDAECKSLIPEPTAEELAALEASIKLEGPEAVYGSESGGAGGAAATRWLSGKGKAFFSTAIIARIFARA
jgi:hypothetical protein